MSSELISVLAWIEKHSFDQKDTFNFLVGKPLDGVVVKSLKSKISEAALDSYLPDVRAAQKRKPPNKGVKKTHKDEHQDKQDGHVGNITLKKIDKPKPVPKPKAKEPVISEEPAAEKLEIKKVEKTVVVDVKLESKPEPEIELEPIQQESQPEQEPVKTQSTQNQPAQNEPKKTAFTAAVSKNVDPAILARIQKSQQEKASIRNNQKGGRQQQGNRNDNRKPTSATGYSGNLRAQPRQIKQSSSGFASKPFFWDYPSRCFIREHPCS